MRHSLLAFFSLASLPVLSAVAAPFAEYYPASGDIVFRDVLGIQSMLLSSPSRRLNANIAAAAFELTPSDGTAPTATGSDRNAGWRINPSAPFDFDSLRVFGAVQPRTSVNDLLFGYDSGASQRL
jgi:hypothetical protein